MDRIKFLKGIVEMSNHLDRSVAFGILNQGELPEHILGLEGMSSDGIRIFLNKLCSKMNNYLEVGSWRGSTFISALYKTKCMGVSIDSHQEYGKGHMFENSAEILEANCMKTLVSGESYKLITSDVWKVKFDKEVKFDAYLYDGFHDYDSQYKALTHFYDNLQDIFYFICDDYNTHEVEEATQKAFKDLDIEVISDHKMFGNQYIPFCVKQGFWNGYYAALCVKRKSFPGFFEAKLHKFP